MRCFEDASDRDDDDGDGMSRVSFEQFLRLLPGRSIKSVRRRSESRGEESRGDGVCYREEERGRRAEERW